MAIRLRRTPSLPPTGSCGPLQILSDALLAGSVILATASAVEAAPASPNQPLSIPPEVLTAPPCRLVVPADLPALQPLRILPSQVAAKNRRGCLSPADAIYGPDGCPRRLCGAAGTFSLPPEPSR
ncbi:MAG: hypothetical protein VKO65_05570 [Cyanobacteriota bacterium]|nr:hypothetical protein [Cyanobacteriota bacterium]